VPEPAAASPRPVLLAFAFVAVLMAAPYVRAALRPPPGTAFTGAFYFTDDVYHYLSYVQQAEEGSVLFRNKLLPEPHAPALVNLEWWLAGRLSALTGRRPMLAWRLLALPAALALLFVVDAWLRRGGLPASHRLPALLLVCCGAGLGGVLFRLGLAADPVDLSTGLFPVMELLTNPHFVVGTALAAGALLALAQGTRTGTIAGVCATAAAGLVRPYDLVMIVLARGLGVALTEPPRRWIASLLPLAAVTPVVLYDYWLFYRNRAFSVLSAPTYPMPFLAGLCLAVAPALALAASSLRLPPEGRRARSVLWAWVVAAALVVALRPVSYSLQFLAGIGLPLLALGALGLGRFRPRATVAALLALSTTLLAAAWIVTRDNPRWFVPKGRLQAARGLRPACRAGDVAMAPPDVGLYALGLSPCTPFVSHPVMDRFERRVAEARSFYTEWPPAVRAAFLDAHCVSALALPADAGPAAEDWLGAGSPFRRSGAGPGWAVYARPRPFGCRPLWP
jgi:hypothetical protein